MRGTKKPTWHKETDMTVYGFLPRIDLALHRNWDLEFEMNFSYLNIVKGHDPYFLGVDANILFKPIQRNWGSLFLLAGGGLGYNNAGNRVRGIGDSHCGGIAEKGTGIYYKFGKRWALRGEYLLYHISDPFSKDTGLNTQFSFRDLILISKSIERCFYPSTERLSAAPEPSDH